MIPCIFEPSIEIGLEPVIGTRMRTILYCRLHDRYSVMEVHMFGRDPYNYVFTAKRDDDAVIEMGVFNGKASSRIHATVQAMVGFLKKADTWTEEFKAKLDAHLSSSPLTKRKMWAGDAAEVKKQMMKAINE
jgi:hypothetical protein